MRLLIFLLICIYLEKCLGCIKTYTPSFLERSLFLKAIEAKNEEIFTTTESTTVATTPSTTTPSTTTTSGTTTTTTTTMCPCTMPANIANYISRCSVDNQPSPTVPTTASITNCVLTVNGCPNGYQFATPTTPTDGNYYYVCAGTANLQNVFQCNPMTNNFFFVLHTHPTDMIQIGCS